MRLSDCNDNHQLLELLTEIGMRFDYLYKRLKDRRYGIKALKRDFLEADFSYNLIVVEEILSWGIIDNCRINLPSQGKTVVDYLVMQLTAMLPAAENIEVKRINGLPLLQYQVPIGQLIVRKSYHIEDTTKEKLYWFRSTDQLINLSNTRELKSAIKRLKIYPVGAPYYSVYRTTKPIKKCLHSFNNGEQGIMTYFGLLNSEQYDRYENSYLGIPESQWFDKLNLHWTSSWVDNKYSQAEIITNNIFDSLELVESGRINKITVK